MSGKKRQAPRHSKVSSPLRQKLDVQCEAFLEHYQRRNFTAAKQAAEALTRDFPGAIFGWKALGTCLMESGDAEQALPALEHALTINESDVETLANLGKTLQQLGRYAEARHFLEQALEAEPDNHQVHLNLAHILSEHGKRDAAIDHLNKSIEATPSHALPQMRKATVLVEQRNYDAALEILEPLAKINPKNAGIQSNLGNLYSTMGRFDEAEHHYRRAVELMPRNPLPYSNYYFTAHYNPRHNAKDFFGMADDWRQRYSPTNRPERPETSREKDRPLRVGLVSSGLRIHPVGRMITTVLEHISPGHLAFYAYSDKLPNDTIAKRIKQSVSVWHDIGHLSHAALAEKIAEDQIDIMIDLTGHTAGNRLPAMALEPAPLIIKWVGGLFNTTGLDAFDYLISDNIETPSGVDDLYFEKLIRLPDDYICYMPTEDAPPVSEQLPARRNGYITLGCFNNPAKINEPLLREWAQLLHQLPNSRLFLKGGQFTNEAFCESIYRYLEAEGIERERVLLEGPSSHSELMRTYQQVDIALDSWPYSGGLTTCEALLMGVPVVTMPGPTFAGRHSATHLVNAGLPELVVNSWDEYRERVVELAGDLGSLDVIRQGLRKQLIDSPVCDAPRFAAHFVKAMKAVWQRHCQHKTAAALTFNQEGEAWFEDEQQPVAIQVSKTAIRQPKTGIYSSQTFNWKLPNKIIVIDNSAKLIRQSGIESLRQLNALGIIAFDPTSQVENSKQFEDSEDVQVFPHAVLGNGEPATLYACLSPDMISTLKPLPPEQLSGAKQAGAKVLTELPINTIALNSIQGLDSLDWLILDDLSDANSILENGDKALADTLIIQVRMAFQPSHERQPNLAETQHWMGRHGFRFYRFNDMAYQSHLPESVSAEKRQATELQSADAIFLPSHERMVALTDNQRIKLAFLLHTVYGIKDMAYELLAEVDEVKAEGYLDGEGLLKKPSPKEHQEIPNDIDDDTISDALDKLMR